MTMTNQDIDLFKREPELPALSVLFDGEQLGREIAQRLGVPLIEATPNYVRLKPGVNCLVGYRFAADGLPNTGYAKVFAPRDRPKLHKAAKSFKRLGLPESSTLLLEDLLTVIHLFPNDNRLPSLSVLNGEDTRRDLMRHLFGDGVGSAPTRIVPIRHKPERRFVALIETADGKKSAVKFLLGRDFQAAKIAAKEVVRRSGVRAPCLVGNSDRYQVLAFEWLEGAQLTDQLGLGDCSAGTLDALGAMLVKFHKSRAQRLAYRSNGTVRSAIGAAVSSVTHVMPELASQANEAARLVSESLERNSAAVPVPIHGDFYADQVIVRSDEVAILDFDRAVFGHLESDVGNLLAHLQYDALRGLIPEATIPEIREHVVEAYSVHRLAMDEEMLSALTAASLLQLLPQPFRSREDRWPELTTAILSRANTLLSESRRGSKSSALSAEQPQRTWSSVLAEATDPERMDYRLTRLLQNTQNASAERFVKTATVVKHRTGRRCLIEYELSNGEVILGKTRAKGFDRRAWALQKALWDADFGLAAEDGVLVAEPLGDVPELNMWLQRKIGSPDAWVSLRNGRVSDSAVRLARAIVKLQRMGPPTKRYHGLEDEIEVLSRQLESVPKRRPEFASALSKFERACSRLVDALPPWNPVPCHRDFYPDNILMDEGAVWLVDLDLYCLSHPALDAGNCVGHLWEAAIRGRIEAQTVENFEGVFVDHLSEQLGRDVRFEVEALATLTLGRHVAISQRIQDRKPYAEDILRRVMRQLAVLAPSAVSGLGGAAL